MSDYGKRVEMGAALLDQHQPGWDSTVNLADINMARTSNCVLGQVFGSYYDGLRALGLDDSSEGGARTAYGFYIPTRTLDLFREYDRLGQTWRDLILARRSTTHKKEAARDRASR